MEKKNFIVGKCFINPEGNNGGDTINNGSDNNGNNNGNSGDSTVKEGGRPKPHIPNSGLTREQGN